MVAVCSHAHGCNSRAASESLVGIIRYSLWHHNQVIETPLSNDMSLVVRKPVFGDFDLVPHKPGCTATEDD